MKKLYIMFALILSSFFFYSNGVNASTYNFNDKFVNYDYSFYWDMEKAVKNKMEELSLDYFVIIYYGGNPRAYIGNNFTISSCTTTSSGAFCSFTCDNCSRFYFSDGSLIFHSSSTGSSIPLYTDPYFLLGTNYNFIYSGGSHEFIYNSINFDLTSGNEFPTYFDLLNFYGIDINYPEPEDIHKEEKEVISNFYLLIFEKIDLLANSILSDYIYLTIIVIFILIFLIELIRRYLL